MNRWDVALTAQAIYNEADESLDAVSGLEEQEAIPAVEASDFRASLRRIRELAEKLGADDHHHDIGAA